VRILILGGTVFLGRHLVDAARAHALTLFNRGRSNPSLFPDVEQVHANRDGGLAALGDRRWDAVVDLCGYVPRVVRQSVAAIRADRYCFVSTISVHPDMTAPRLDESAPVATLAEPTETVTAETYGALKALCEREVDAARALIVRPGLIVGPHDPSDRFTYWPARLARGGTILAPGRPERRAQFIDARDLAAWIVRLLEAGTTGTFNATGDGVAMKDVLAGGDLRWVDDDFLLAQKVAPYTDLPLWIPHADDDVVCARAKAAGLTFRPLAETMRDVGAWDRTRPAGPRRCGLTAEREAELLVASRAR